MSCTSATSKTNGIEKPYPGLPLSTVEKIKQGEVAMQVDWVRVYASAPHQ